MISLALSVIEGFLGIAPETEISVLSGLYSLAVLLPSLGVSVRRLHDTGRSGWWLLVGVLPIFGGIILLIFFVTDSQPGENRYGPNPKGVLASGADPASTAGSSTKAITAAVVALLALGICAFLSILLIGPAVGNVFDNTVSEITGVSAAAGENFMQALKDSDYNTAYALLRPDLQDELSGADALGTFFPPGVIDTWEYDTDFITTTDGESAVEMAGVLTLSDGSQLDMQIIVTRVGEENLVAGFLFQPQE